MSLAVVVLAAGEGKRMRTRRAKVLHEAGGSALLDHVLAAADDLGASPVVIVVGHLRDQVAAHLGERDVAIVVQDPPRGTGDAVRCALATLPETGEVVVVSGDTPLLQGTTLADLVRVRGQEGAVATVLTALLPDGGNYGRVVRDSKGSVAAIVEARDATADERAINEVNAGAYCFDLEALRVSVATLAPDNAQGEYYLTDVVADMVRRGHQVSAVILADPVEMAGVNTRAQLAEVHRALNERVLRRLEGSGVTVLDPRSTWVEAGCVVGSDVVLEPGVHLRGRCVVGDGCRVGALSVLENVELPGGTVIAPGTVMLERAG